MPVVAVKTAPNRRNRQYEKRLDSILRAASMVMAKDGFEGASVRKVAAEARIGISGIYYYFKSKDEMLFALQENTFSLLVDNLAERLRKTGSSREKLNAIIDNHFHFFSEHMDDLKVCSYEIESLSGGYFNDVLKIRRRYFNMVKEVVAENMPPESKMNSGLAALFLFGSLNWIFMWYDPKRNADIDILSRQLMKIYLEGIAT